MRTEQNRLDILVNNAAAVYPDMLRAPGPFWEKPLQLVDMIDVGLRSNYVASYHAAPLMAEARRGLRQKGLFYQKGTRRMFLPAELAGEGMPLRLANLAATRCAAPLTFADMVSGGEHVPVIMVGPDGEMQRQCPARLTHDGFRALCIPVGANRNPVAVLIGQIARHIEIEAILAVSTDDYVHTRVGFAAQETPITPLLDGIVEYAPGLWHCQTPHAFALIQPPALDQVPDLMLVMVFRALGRADQSR